MSDLLTVEEAAALSGFPVATIRRWRRRGQVRAVRRRGGPRGLSHLFHREDVERMAGLSPWDGTHTDAASVWLSTRVAAERYGVSPDRLDRWRESDVPMLGGKRLRAKMIIPVELCGGGKRCRPRRVYLAEDLDRIAAGLPRDDDWLTAAEVRDRYGFSVMTLWKWRKEGCPYLDGSRLRSHKQQASVAHRGGEKTPHEKVHHVRVFARADLDRIAAGYRAAPEATAEADWLTYREARSAYGLSQATLSWWNTKGCRHLPGGRKLASRLCRAGVGNRMMTVLKYSRADLDLIARVRAADDTDEGPAGGGPAADAATPTPELAARPELPPNDLTPARRCRGRKRGWTDPVAEKRNKVMVEAWDAGRHKSVADLARAFHLSRRRAGQILKAHGRRPGVGAAT
jgi:predicted site-specific integrase-resolvase